MVKKICTSALAVVVAVIFIGCSVPELVDVSEVDYIDLTEMNDTLEYVQLIDMQVNKSAYDGKEIKMEGEYSTEYSEEIAAERSVITVKHDPSCCPNGIPQVIEIIYPEDAEATEEGDEIVIVGEFKTYKIGETEYCQIVVSEVNPES